MTAAPRNDSIHCGGGGNAVTRVRGDPKVYMETPLGSMGAQEGAGQPWDTSLALRSRQGDLAAFESLARRYQDRVYTYALRMVGDAHEAADLTQDTLFRAFWSLERFDAALPFAPWLFGIAAHVCRDSLRRRGRREQPWEDLDAVAGTRDAAAQAVANEEQARVIAAVQSLPLKYREVIVLHYMNEMGYEEVAKSLGITAAAARRRALRAREMLRRHLAEE